MLSAAMGRAAIAEEARRIANQDDPEFAAAVGVSGPTVSMWESGARTPKTRHLIRIEELAAGAIASGGVRVLNEDIMRAIPHADQAIEAVTARETAELERREEIYREGRPTPELRDWIVILVDDGLATGATMRAAVKALRQRGAAKIVVAVPVGPPDTCHEIEEQADETICLSTPEFFQAVGQYYDDFSQTTDEDVRELLVQAAQEQK